AVGVLEVAPDRDAARDTGHPDARRLEQLLQVGRCNLPFHGRIGRDDDLPHAGRPAVGDAGQQTVEPQRLGADALEGRQPPAQHEASFFASAWYSSAARCCACATAASTRSSSISTSPWAMAWGSILIARICPRPSAVADTIPPPAVQVTVCWASWDWISDSRNCICCPSCSRLDKSAIRRKLPLAETGGKLLEQLQIQRVHGRIETRVTRTQRLQPLLPYPLLRETAGPRSGPLPPLPALPALPALPL